MSQRSKTVLKVVIGLLVLCAVGVLVTYAVLGPVRAAGFLSRPAGASGAALDAPEVPASPLELTVEDYPIVTQEADAPDHLEYMQRLSAAVLNKRQTRREPSPARLVESANKALTAFGYRLEPASLEPVPTYQLHRDDTVIRKGITRFWPVTVNEKTDDFVLPIEIQHRNVEIVQCGKVQAWDPGPEVRPPPVYYGNELIATYQEGWQTVRVKRGDEVLYTVQIEPQVDNPVKGLWVWNGHWVLEVDSQLIIDGQNLDQELGYDEIFGWTLLDGNPFYFFAQDGHIGLSYAGETLPFAYEKVVHNQCCEPAAFNPRHNEDMVWFHALKNGTWYYVEAGIYR